jgi:anhydro-N-acetylmuramic acid kinase
MASGGLDHAASTGRARVKMLRAIGLMSGTSLDGVDAAWIETDGRRVGRLGPSLTLPYDDMLRADLRRILDIAPGLAADDPFLADVVARLTRRHAEAVAAVGEAADVIGFHGQTILHQPRARRTWQVGDAVLLARKSGMCVVHDFRTTDVAQGGQGAPLAPAYHAALAHGLDLPVAVLNLGGVGNVTWIGADDALVAFDTGPGNGPLDDWAARHSNHGFDADGALSATGRADDSVLGRLMGHPYFERTGAKSLDRLDFGRALAASGLEALSPADGAATLVAFTAAAVAASRLPAPPKRWLVCGGGRHNPSIMAALRARLPAPVDPVEAVGWDGDALEAQCFGFLAVRSLAGLPISFPGTTGAPAPLTGGSVAEPGPPDGASQ